MLGSDLFAYASVGRYMADYARFTKDNSKTGSSVEAETDRVLSTMYAQKSQQETSKSIEETGAPAPETHQEKPKDPTQKVGPDGKAYTKDEEKEIEELEDRDAEVKRHEQAHFQAAGKYASPPKYEYQTGPDGKRYAVGGSVDIDMSEVPDDPQATLEKARVIKRAALAPEEPSAQDRKVAREADKMATQAQRQIGEQRVSGSSESTDAARASTEDSSAKTLKEIAAEGISHVATRSLEIDPAQNFASDMVHQFRTSRLQMSNAANYKTETLASPRQHVSFRSQGLSFDHYV